MSQHFVLSGRALHSDPQLLQQLLGNLCVECASQ